MSVKTEAIIQKNSGVKGLKYHEPQSGEWYFRQF